MLLNPTDIIYHIFGVELGRGPSNVDQSKLSLSRLAHSDWKMGFTVNKRINSKRLIEGLARETRLFPFFKGDKLSFNSILDNYYEAEYEIKDLDVISYKFNRTKVEDIKTRCVLSYHYDYSSDDFKKSTESNTQVDTAKDFFDGEYSNDYYGIEGEQGEDLIEVKYIRDDETAEKLQRFLLAWYCNQHNICKIRIPLSYLYAEVGDIVAFSTLLGGKKAYGEDYSLNYFEAVIRNGQQILPYWMVMGVNKNLEYVELNLIQLHNLTTTISEVPEPPEPEIPIADFIFQSEISETGETITSVIEGETVYLNPHHFLANSYDPDGGVLWYDWSHPSHDNFQLSDYSAMNPYFIAPAQPDGETEVLTVRLRVGVGTGDQPSPHVNKNIAVGDFNSIIINYIAGWNMIGLPFNVADANYSTLFPNDMEQYPFYFGIGWQPIEGNGVNYWPMLHGVGYIAFFSASGSTIITGTPLEILTIQINVGWNVISGIGYPVQVEDIIDPDAILIPGGVYAFGADFSYSEATVIEPGKSYWVRASTSGEITLSV